MQCRTVEAPVLGSVSIALFAARMCLVILLMMPTFELLRARPFVLLRSLDLPVVWLMTRALMVFVAVV